MWPQEQRCLQGSPRTPVGATRDLYSSLRYILALFRKRYTALSADSTNVPVIFFSFGFDLALPRCYISP